MIEAQRRAYLEAMGLEVWMAKPPEPDFSRLVVQPGEGGTLLVCEPAEATATRIAGDISRVLAGEAVWAWPDPEGNQERPGLEDVVSQQLFTRVVLFGKNLQQQLFRGEVPLVVGSARIISTVSIEELAVQGSAKQTFWKRLIGVGNN